MEVCARVRREGRRAGGGSQACQAALSEKSLFVFGACGYKCGKEPLRPTTAPAAARRGMARERRMVSISNAGATSRGGALYTRRVLIAASTWRGAERHTDLEPRPGDAACTICHAADSAGDETNGAGGAGTSAAGASPGEKAGAGGHRRAGKGRMLAWPEGNRN